jgi:hypothetical protein
MSVALSIDDVDALTVDPREAFAARCWARARLYAEGELDLHDAVDVLQHWGERLGLIKQIGQDGVQAMMSEAFAAVRDDLPEAADSVAIARDEHVPQSTLDAADFVKREGDAERLRRWLAGHRKYLPGILQHWEKRGN